MTVLTTLFPVFFMLLLGLVSHIKGWVTVNQKNGANSIIFKILFPVLVFNLMANANIELSHISIILYVYIAYLVILVIGKFITQHITKDVYKRQLLGKLKLIRLILFWFLDILRPLTTNLLRTSHSTLLEIYKNINAKIKDIEARIIQKWVWTR